MNETKILTENELLGVERSLVLLGFVKTHSYYDGPGLYRATWTGDLVTFNIMQTGDLDRYEIWASKP